MKTFIAICCLCGSAIAADTIEEMKAAIVDNEVIQAKATALWDAKNAYDAALADYKRYRNDHHNLALSKESAPFVLAADKIIDFKTDPAAQKILDEAAAQQAKADTDKQQAEAQAANGIAERRANAQRRITVAQARLTNAVTAYTNAQKEYQQAQSVARGASNTQGTRVITGGGAVDDESFQAKIAAAHKAMKEAEAALRQAQFDNAANVDIDMPSSAGPNFGPPGPGPNPPPSTPPLVAKPSAPRVILTMIMKDGRKIEAMSSMEAGDVYIIKTATGVQKLKKDDVEKIERNE